MTLLLAMLRSKDARYLTVIAILAFMVVMAGRKITQLEASPKIVERVVVETHFVEKKVAGPVVVREKIIMDHGIKTTERVIERAAVTTDKNSDVVKESEKIVTPGHVDLWSLTGSLNPRDGSKSLGLSRSLGFISIGYSHDVGRGAKLENGHHINLGIPLF